jgi:phytoene dehydrogenase-like protein
MARTPGKRQHYDVVVLGSQLGGLTAAALLAKRGHRVLVVDHDGLGDGYLDGGYTLPYAPALLPPLKSLPAAESAFGELGMLTELGRAATPHDPELQLLLSGHRFDLSRDPVTRTRELTREFGDARMAESVWSGLVAASELADPFFKSPLPFPADGFMEGWQEKRRIRADAALQKAVDAPAPAGHPLAAIARELAAFVSYRDGEPLTGLPISRALALWLRGPQRIAGGREGIRALLHKRIKELGGDILGTERGNIAEELEVDGARVTGVKLVGGDATYVGRAVISATDAGALRRLVPPQARKKKLAEQLDAVRLKRFMLVVNLVVPEAQLPLGLAPLGVLATDDDLLGLLVYEVTPAQKVGAKGPAEDRVLTVGALVPAQARELGEEHLELLAARIRDAMLAVLPFAQPRLYSVPLLTKSTARGSRLVSHPLFEIDEQSTLGVTGLSAQTPLKNLFLASREVLPGLGLEGELLTALNVAARVQSLLKKKDPLAGP